MSKFFVILVCIICVTYAFAQNDETLMYYKAYRACSSKAQNQALSGCNYAKTVENYYTVCMAQSGYNDSQEAIDKDHYPAYLETYRKCTAIANNAAQQQCNYAGSFKAYYNACMLSRGYDAEGDPISKTPRNNNDIEKGRTKQPNDDGLISRFLDSIL